MATKKVQKNQQITDSIEIENKRIKNFLNVELKSYAQYVLRTRTMPNIMDGLRLGARKIIYASLTGDVTKKKFVKMQALQGDVLKLQYAHGDASLSGTIVNLCCSHLNKYAPLEAIGQIPSLRVPKCDTATRYLSIRKSPFLEIYNVDKELLSIQEEEGEKIEPKYFLPIIPLVLLNRSSSPGFGFSFKACSYKLDDIIDNCIKAINDGTCASEVDSLPLTPEIVGIKQENIIYNAAKKQWFNVGEFEMDFKSDTLIIRDLPYDVSFESFEESLQNLKDKFTILDWTNLSQKEKITYVVKLPKGRMTVLFNSNKWKFFQMFKLYSSINNDILNCIDQDGESILFFETPQQLIDCFVKKRLVYYNYRKIRTIRVLKEKIEEYNNRIKFINMVVDGTLVVVKRRLTEIKKDLSLHNIPNYVLDMKIWNLTTEEIESLIEKSEETKKHLEYIEKTSIQEMYVMELIDFKKKYSEINKVQIS